MTDDETRRPPDPADLAAVKREVAKAVYAELREDVLRRMEYQIGFVQSGLKTLTLVNGGAIIAMFTFLGNFYHDGHALSAVVLGQLRWAFCAFVIGLLSTIGATVAAIFSQQFHSFFAVTEMWKRQAESYGAEFESDQSGLSRTAHNAELILVIFIVAGMLAFATGSSFALRAVVQMQLF